MILHLDLISKASPNYALTVKFKEINLHYFISILFAIQRRFMSHNSHHFYSYFFKLYYLHLLFYLDKDNLASYFGFKISLFCHCGTCWRVSNYESEGEVLEYYFLGSQLLLYLYCSLSSDCLILIFWSGYFWTWSKFLNPAESDDWQGYFLEISSVTSCCF